MERFVKIIKKGTNSSTSAKSLVKIDKNDNPNKYDKINNSKQELVSNITKKTEEYINPEYTVNHIHNSINDVQFNKIDDNLSDEIKDKLKIGEDKKKMKKADTSLNVPIMKLNGKPNPFYSPSIGKKLTNFGKNDIIFCQLVDGVKPDMPYEALVTKFNYISKQHKTLFVYIYPDDSEDITNVSQFKKNNIFSSYLDNFRNLDEDKFFFISEEQDKNTFDNRLIQLHTFVKNYNVSFIVSSYEGLAGPNGNLKELELNIKYLLKSIEIPVILFKEPIYLTIEEREKESANLNWLFVFDMNDTRCYSILNKFLGLIDQEKDFVYGLTFLPATLKKDDIELNFMNEMKLRKIKNYSYEMVNNNKEPYKTVIDLVNNGEVHFNFVVIYNKIKPVSNQVVKKEKINDNNIHIIDYCNTNICFCSGL